MTVLLDSEWSSVSAILGGKAPKSAGDINRFLDRVRSVQSTVDDNRLTPTPTLLQGKAYAKENIFNLISSRPDPVTNFEWIAIVENKGFATKQAIPWHYIDDVATPSINISTQTKFKAGRNVKFAEMFGVDTCTIKVYNDRTGVGVNFCNDWIRSVYRDDDFYQMPVLYKKTIKIWILDAARKVVTDVQLIGCWPASWSTFNLVSSASSMLEISLTLEVDDIRFNFNPDLNSVIEKIEGMQGNNPSGQSSLAGNAWASLNSQSGISPLNY